MKDNERIKINFKLKPIGILKTPYEKKAPPQPDTKGKGDFKIIIYPEYTEGLYELDKFKYAYILYFMNRTQKNFSLKVNPPWSKNKVGLFASRSPNRINPIGLSVVEILKIEKNIIYTSPMDAFNNTPLLDIKPYIKLLDVKEAFTFNNLSKCFCEISLGSKGNEFDEFGNNFGTIWSVGETVIIEDNSYDFGIVYDTCLNLQEIGLISNKEYFEDDDIVRKVSFIENGETQSYYLNKARLSIFEFTKIGFELFEIANHHLNPEYKKEILEHLKGNIN